MNYQAFIKSYFKKHEGEHKGDPHAMMRAAAAAWDREKSGGSRSSGGGGKKRTRSRAAANCESTIVPTEDGTDVTTRAGGHLRAAFEGHVEVQFNQGALGAVWAGIIERLRSKGSMNLAALFPDLYPEANLALRANRQYADQRVTGNQMAPVLGPALVAYAVTPEEWASFYVAATGQKFIIPAERGTCVVVSASMGGGQLPAGLPPGAAMQGQMGGVLGAPSGALLPGQQFGTVGAR